MESPGQGSCGGGSEPLPVAHPGWSPPSAQGCQACHWLSILHSLHSRTRMPWPHGGHRTGTACPTPIFCHSRFCCLDTVLPSSLSSTAPGRPHLWSSGMQSVKSQLRDPGTSPRATDHRPDGAAGPSASTHWTAHIGCVAYPDRTHQWCAEDLPSGARVG